MEEQTHPPNNIHHFPITTKYHSFFSSLFFITLSILFLYFFFPSQPPHFINHYSPSLSMLWELIPLFFIGIALSYAFFLLRNTRTDPTPDPDDRYFSGLSQISSLFDFGFEGVNGYHENLMVGYKRNVLKNQSFSEEEMTISETKSFDYGYLNGGSVGREKCGLDHLGKLKRAEHFSPLNLPVRSLRSKAVKNCGNVVSVEEIGSDLGSVRFCEENDEVRGLIPINLEKKFEEAVALPSPVPWGSRLSRVEGRDKFKPLSHTLGGFEHEKLNSQSVLNTVKVVQNLGNDELDGNMSQRSFTHLRDLPAKELDLTKVEPKSKYFKVRDKKRNAKSPPCLRAAPVDEFGNNEKKLETIMGLMETRGKEGNAKTLSQSESFWSAIYSPISSPNISPHLTPMSTEAWNPKLEDLRNGDITLKTFNKSVTEEIKEKMDAAAAPTKYLRRGKSVRTTKRKESCMDDAKREKNYSALVDEIPEKTKGHNNLQNVSLDEMSKTYDYRNVKTQMSCRSSKSQTEKETFGNIENFKVTLGEEADPAIAENEELSSDEVDKKADAFIAKFREQIRRQKIDSIKRKR